MEYAQKTGAARREAHHVNYWDWAKTGMIGGFVAALTFALFEMIMGAATGGSFFGVFRVYAAAVYGEAAFSPQVTLANAILVGSLVHLVYSVVAGAVFALIIATIGPLHASTLAIVLSASVLGLLMWLVNFFLFAPAAGWNWLLQANQLVQFIAHTFFYGTVAGLVIAAKKK